MAKLPRSINNLIEAFERLPGIGPKTAQRLTFYLLHVPEHEIEKFSQVLLALKKKTVVCSTCYNVAEKNPCPICEDKNRGRSRLLVVEQPIDVLHFEQTGKYDGLYHVLHGRIDPLNNIGPEDIYIDQLLERASALLAEGVLEEVILAMNSDMEGEATCMYIAKKLRKFKTENSRQEVTHSSSRKQDVLAGEGSEQAKLKTLKITRLAHGLPVGASVEFTDEVTLGRALEGRRIF